MKLTTTIGLTLVLLLIASSASFYAGIKVDTWKTGAAAAQSLQTSINALAGQQTQRITEFNQLSAKIDALNQATQDGSLATQQKIEDQDHALSLIHTQLGKVALGSCTFTPAADKLLQQTYQAIYPGTGSGSAGSTGASRLDPGAGRPGSP